MTTDKIKRNYGIDLLRMASMYMVCILHVLRHGGVLAATSSNRINNIIAWSFEIAAYCAVNCFALISGYVGCKSTFKLFNFFRLYLQVLFYTFSISLIFKFIYPMASFGIKEFVKSLFPNYWYFNAYTLMFFITPQMNFLIQKQSKESLCKLIWIFFGIFSMLAMIPVISQIASPVSRGYSAIWLAYLYMIGGFIRVYEINDLIPEIPWKKKMNKIFFNNQKGLLSIYIICICVTFFLFTCGHCIVKYILGCDYFCSQYLSYNSPTILLASVSLLVFFSRLNVSSIVFLIRMGSPLAFSVYLIHDNDLVRKYLMKGNFEWMAGLPTYLLPFAIIFVPLVIYIVCSFIDYLRLKVFKIFRLT